MTDENCNTIVLAKASGLELLFDAPDGEGRCAPLTLDRNALRQNDDGSWTETQGNGLRLHYQYLSAEEHSVEYVLCDACDVGLGYQRNLLGAGYAVPHVGRPVDAPQNLGHAGEPDLCALDHECSYDPYQVPAGPYGPPAGPAGPVYLSPGTPDPLGRAVGLAFTFVRGFDLPTVFAGNDLGTRAAFTCGVNLTSGNLLASFATPAAGPAAPPVRFYYNSQSRATSE